MNLVINRFKAYFSHENNSIIGLISVIVYFSVLLLLLKVISDLNVTDIKFE